jgi:hypothetical protein
MVDLDECASWSVEGTAIFQIIQSIALSLTITKSKTQTLARNCLVHQVSLLPCMVHCTFEQIDRVVNFSLDCLDLTLDDPYLLALVFRSVMGKIFQSLRARCNCLHVLLFLLGPVTRRVLIHFVIHPNHGDRCHGIQRKQFD